MVSNLKDSIAIVDFEEAIKLTNKANEILWDRLQKPLPFHEPPTYKGKQVRSVPVLGVHRREQQDYQVAIYVAEKRDEEIIEPIFKEIPREKIDFQVTGSVIPYSSSSVSIGDAISHFGCSKKGTLGCFVQKRDNEGLFILSNNHVLANLNKGQRGKDSIILHNPTPKVDRFRQVLHKWFLSLFQSVPPAYSDSVTRDEQRSSSINEIAVLTDYIDLIEDGTNLVDAAIAKVNNPKLVRLNEIKDVGKLKGYHNKDSIKNLDPSLKFTKLGQKTGQTWGKLRTFPTQFSMRYSDEFANCKFEDIMTFEAAENSRFGDHGDSGSLVVDENGYAVALLFAGSEKGGRKNLGITYGIPIYTILKELDVELVLTI
ncbi:MAG: hypothetical protein RMY29_019065 [Nostoc sp. CreGUA01]|nr:hypothetical protein [Nostoc sp. CreGUA01]